MSTVERLPVEEVMTRAARASQNFQSALFDGRVRFGGENPDGTAVEGVADIDGTMQEGGSQVRVHAEGSVILVQGTTETTVTIDAEVIVDAENEAFLRVNTLESDPKHPVFSSPVVENLLGQWWILPSSPQQPVTVFITPDPSLFRAQSQVVRVVEEHGFTQVNGRTAYHYTTEVDKEKLRVYLQDFDQQNDREFDEEEFDRVMGGANLTGELWIDAQTFVVLKVSWSSQDISLQNGGTFFFSFEMQMHDHDAAIPIVLPTDAQPLALPGVPEMLPTLGIEDLQLPSGMEEDILQQLMEGNAAVLPMPE
jgi:hypothetical protein